LSKSISGCDRNGSVGSFYVVIYNTVKCSKETGHFQGLFRTFKDPYQIPELSRPEKRDFKIQGLSRICTNPE